MDEIPEILALRSRGDLIRIAPEIDVPVTPRVRRLIDTSAFRRLAKISQLGLVSLVYPGAHHSRFEHSLGVYCTGLHCLQQLAEDQRFATHITAREAECFIAAALLHDVGHWPFCHPLEDIRDPRVPRHEALAEELLADEIAGLLEVDWGISSNELTELLCGKYQDRNAKLLSSLLSGPIDVDKMDYLRRDSLHAGVPYGQNFDRARLIGSLCLNTDGSALAITNKGRTAAEMMVFARYVMFSEVYWHHAVRSATAMLQRSFFELLDRLDLQAMFRQTEDEFIRNFVSVARGTRVEAHIQGLFGNKRRLFKRLAQYSLIHHPEIFERLARRPYAWLVKLSQFLAEGLSQATGLEIQPEQILIDAPPVKREVEINLDVYFPKEHQYRRLAEVSPVVRTLAEQQFDDIVKRVRIFVDPEIQPATRSVGSIPELLHAAIEKAEKSEG